MALQPHADTNSNHLSSHGHNANASIWYSKHNLKRRHTPESSDSESDVQPLEINDMLQILHTSMPSFNFPQYRESLLSKGICYGRNVVDFNQSYYVERIGMTDGAAAEFVRSAKRMLGKQKNEHKKRRLTEKENQPTYCESPELYYKVLTLQNSNVNNN
jgi:hypothetical protein